MLYSIKIWIGKFKFIFNVSEVLLFSILLGCNFLQIAFLLKLQKSSEKCIEVLIIFDNIKNRKCNSWLHHALLQRLRLFYNFFFMQNLHAIFLRPIATRSNYRGSLLLLFFLARSEHPASAKSCRCLHSGSIMDGLLCFLCDLFEPSLCLFLQLFLLLLFLEHSYLLRRPIRTSHYIYYILTSKVWALDFISQGA